MVWCDSHVTVVSCTCALQKLDSLPDAKASLEVCEALLQEKKRKYEQQKVEMTETDLKTIIFVLEYMLSRLSISIANKSDYRRRLLGAKVRWILLLLFLLLCCCCSCYCVSVCCLLCCPYFVPSVLSLPSPLPPSLPPLHRHCGIFPRQHTMTTSI